MPASSRGHRTVSKVQRFVRALVQLPPRLRSSIVMSSDLVLCAIAAIIAFWLRQGAIYGLSPVLIFTAIASVAWLATALPRGVYRSVVRFSGRQTVRELAASACIMAMVLAVALVTLRIPGIPRTLSVLHPLVFFLLVGCSRLALSALLKRTLYARRAGASSQVIIYGAGVAGQELALSMREHPELKIVGFVDDNAVLRGRRLDGHRIWHASDLEQLLSTKPISEIFLALPRASRAKRREIVEHVRQISPRVGVRALPNIAEIASGRVSVNDLREIQIEELLGRDQVEPDPRLMSGTIRGKTVMVTGAGGSIGSELSRQILAQGPLRLVLAEQSEHALYLIDTELSEIRRRQGLDVEIVARLIDVADRLDAERVFREWRPDTVFHAAAYKHVPLVEADPMAGIRNNIIGTMTCSELAEAYGAERFILVSTDKAVRPTSVMGASKRVCELIVQARAAAQSSTIYSAVRFGNVLGSSGSVVPLFRRQIAEGGPVTITHLEATRYFMTVSEASQLVIQAGAMAEGGDVFLLDMGEPVRIYDLARMMVELSGLTLGEDIEIVEIGLRPGEKIHEELLIGECGMPTPHPRIVKACETAMDWAYLQRRLGELVAAIDARNAESALALVKLLVGEKLGPSDRARRPQRVRRADVEQQPAIPVSIDEIGPGAISRKPAFGS
jgi:FlaA1/EpsC-like NDP-sugar epimerase